MHRPYAVHTIALAQVPAARSYVGTRRAHQVAVLCTATRSAEVVRMQSALFALADKHEKLARTHWRLISSSAVPLTRFILLAADRHHYLSFHRSIFGRLLINSSIMLNRANKSNA